MYSRKITNPLCRICTIEPGIAIAKPKTSEPLATRRLLGWKVCQPKSVERLKINCYGASCMNRRLAKNWRTMFGVIAQPEATRTLLM
jgi:hypothetical protein